MSAIEAYLDELFDRLAGTGAAGRRSLAEAEDHLRSAAAEAMAAGVTPEQAERDAVARFGPANTLAAALAAAAVTDSSDARMYSPAAFCTEPYVMAFCLA